MSEPNPYLIVRYSTAYRAGLNVMQYAEDRETADLILAINRDLETDDVAPFLYPGLRHELMRLVPVDEEAADE